MAGDNLTVTLASRPTGEIEAGKTLALKKLPAPSASDLKDGQILVEVLYLSLDPTLRPQMNESRSYIQALQLDAPMRGIAVSRVIASRSKLAGVGDCVTGYTSWSQYTILNDGTFEPASSFPAGTTPKDMLSSLGGTSLTAWYGMLRIGDPKPGETVVVSAAAGATGSVAGQIAKLKGARVVGMAGTDEKCKWLTEELGFDVALNYKDADFKEKLEEATKDYIDVYFDNVGGKILDMCLLRAKEHARFVLCGAISQYNSLSKPQPIHALTTAIVMRLRLQGFIITDHRDLFPEAREELAKWIAEGKIKVNETVVKGGLEKAEQSLIELYRGSNTGKFLVEVKNPDEAPSKL